MDDIIRAGALWGFEPLVRSLGFPTGGLLVDAGLSKIDLSNPDQYISRSAAINLLEIAAWKLKCPDFGLRLARIQDVNILGALAFSVRNAPNFRSAIQATAKHLNYHAPVPTIFIQPSKIGAAEEVVVDMRFEPPESCHQTVEKTIALACRIARHLSGGALRPVAVKFAHHALAPEQAYAAYLGLAPDFEGEVNGITYKSADLDLSLKTADHRLQSLVERYLDANSPPSGQIERRVYQTLALSIRAATGTSIEEIADLLRMPVSALQRSLSEAGTNFEQLQNDVRRDIARTYLADEMFSTAHVAKLLGFASRSAFAQSCERWFGSDSKLIRRVYAGQSRPHEV